ncbi:MAG TPA: hypothetical protein P5572_10505 [Phycisphaerae bacterium]|nr:hypothetical protein [Phycisphaerales bacterium]HRX85438.1 hypothetical protein [Phycisphaerae bacterium]
MNLRKWTTTGVLALAGCIFLPCAGCAEHKEKKEVEVHTPNHDYEVEVEKKTHHDHD